MQLSRLGRSAMGVWNEFQTSRRQSVPNYEGTASLRNFGILFHTDAADRDPQCP